MSTFHIVKDLSPPPNSHNPRAFQLAETVTGEMTSRNQVETLLTQSVREKR